MKKDQYKIYGVPLGPKVPKLWKSIFENRIFEKWNFDFLKKEIFLIREFSLKGKSPFIVRSTLHNTQIGNLRNIYSFFGSLCNENLYHKRKMSFKGNFKNRNFDFSIFEFSIFQFLIFQILIFRILKFRNLNI